MTPLRAKIEIALFILAWLIATLMIFLIASEITHAQEALSGILTANLSTGEARYTETNDYSESYGVRTTATVLPNECNTSACGACLCVKQPSECMDVCEGVIYY